MKNDTTPAQAVIDQLNTLGADGWHVVAQWPSNREWGRTLILEREK